MPNDEFEIDLSNFEAGQKKRFADQVESDEIVATRPWDDDRAFEDLYSEESIWKASLLIKDGRVEKIRDNLYSVAGSTHYNVSLIDGDNAVPWALCTCPNGEARGGRPSCYHTAAVLALRMGLDLSGLVEPQKRKAPARN